MTLFAQESWLIALAAVPVLAVIAAAVRARRRARLARLIDTPLHGRIVRATLTRTRRAVLLLLALAAGAVAMARPLGGEITDDFTRSGHDVIFVVDVSRSMLAEDVAPNRLERAKQIVRDGLTALRSDRVAVVAFAGSSVVKCPLTLDTAFARLAIDELSPESVARGGSKIGDALRTTLESLIAEEDEGRHRDVVLITDGGDHESFPVEAAGALAARNTRLITVGLGHPSGTPVPGASGQPMMYEGAPVISALDADTLERMARMTPGGVYLPVGDGYIEFDKVYAGLAESAERQELGATERTRRAELFQWPLGLALLLLLWERAAHDRR